MQPRHRVSPDAVGLVVNTHTISLLGPTYEHHTVDVVHITVFPTTMMHVVTGHGDFRTIKDGRLVHVVPDEEILGGVLAFISLSEQSSYV